MGSFSKMKDYTYFQEEQLLVYNAGYITADTSENVQEIIGSLSKITIEFAIFAKVQPSEIQTKFFYESTSHRLERIFFVKTPIIPDSELVYVVEGSDWTMMKWFTN